MKKIILLILLFLFVGCSSTKNKIKDVTIINGLMYQNQPFTSQDKNNYENGKSSGRVGNWKRAKDYCSNLTLTDYSDWRLPTNIELKKLLTKNKNRNSHGYYYNINKKFLENMPPLNGKYKGASFWSATENLPFAWIVSFIGGYDGFLSKRDRYYTLCVR